MSMLRFSGCVPIVEPIKPGYNKMTASQDVKDGLPSKNVVFKYTSVQDVYAGISASDFSIANYQAMGIVQDLKVGTFANHDIDTISQLAEEALKPIEQ